MIYPHQEVGPEAGPGSDLGGEPRPSSSKGINRPFPARPDLATDLILLIKGRTLSSTGALDSQEEETGFRLGTMGERDQGGYVGHSDPVGIYQIPPTARLYS